MHFGNHNQLFAIQMKIMKTEKSPLGLSPYEKFMCALNSKGSEFRVVGELYHDEGVFRRPKSFPESNGERTFQF